MFKLPRIKAVGLVLGKYPLVFRSKLWSQELEVICPYLLLMFQEKTDRQRNPWDEPTKGGKEQIKNKKCLAKWEMGTHVTDLRSSEFPRGFWLANWSSEAHFGTASGNTFVLES